MSIESLGGIHQSKLQNTWSLQSFSYRITFCLIKVVILYHYIALAWPNFSYNISNSFIYLRFYSEEVVEFSFAAITE